MARAALCTPDGAREAPHIRGRQPSTSSRPSGHLLFNAHADAPFDPVNFAMRPVCLLLATLGSAAALPRPFVVLSGLAVAAAACTSNSDCSSGEFCNADEPSAECEACYYPGDLPPSVDACARYVDACGAACDGSGGVGAVVGETTTTVGFEGGGAAKWDPCKKKKTKKRCKKKKNKRGKKKCSWNPRKQKCKLKKRKKQ